MPPLTTTDTAAPRAWWVIVLCALFLFTGLTNHDPWKSDDAIYLGLAKHIATEGDWLIPTLAGEPWTEAEPLYPWLAALTGNTGKQFLSFHAAARLASGIFSVCFLLLLSLAARRFYDSEAGWAAPLLAVGTLGLLVPLHEAQPASAILAGIAGAYWGCALLAQRSWFGPPILGACIGLVFLAGGLAPTLPLLILLIAPLLLRQWSAFPIALTIAVLVGGSWPGLLAIQAPTHLESWWSSEWSAITPRDEFRLTHLQWISWFAWPTLILAIWTMWSQRRSLSVPAYALPVLGTAAAAGWFLVHEPKSSITLPLLPPIILLSAAGLARLRRGAANAWDWFGMMTFSLIIALIWLGAVAMLTGWPPKIARNFAKLEPGFFAHIEPLSLATAGVISVAWLFALIRIPRSPSRVAMRWATGVMLMWMLLVVLWMPWIDYGKTYRPVVTALAKALPTDHGCIGRKALGAPQRALLDYWAGIRTQPSSEGCRWLIVQDGFKTTKQTGWQQIWEGHRPGDRNERLRLYRRQ